MESSLRGGLQPDEAIQLLAKNWIATGLSTLAMTPSQYRASGPYFDLDHFHYFDSG